MIKEYKGYSCPCMVYVEFALEYRCPICLTEDVSVDELSPIPSYCDGGPSTPDELREWVCCKCYHRARGWDFKARYFPIEGGEKGQPFTAPKFRGRI